MVKITNNAPLSHVFAVKDGDKVTSKSLPPGATDDFDLADPDSPSFKTLVRDGQVSIPTTVGSLRPENVSLPGTADPPAAHPTSIDHSESA